MEITGKQAKGNAESERGGDRFLSPHLFVSAEFFLFVMSRNTFFKVTTEERKEKMERGKTKNAFFFSTPAAATKKPRLFPPPLSSATAVLHNSPLTDFSISSSLCLVHTEKKNTHARTNKPNQSKKKKEKNTEAALKTHSSPRHHFFLPLFLSFPLISFLSRLSLRLSLSLVSISVSTCSFFLFYRMSSHIKIKKPYPLM